MLPPDLFHPAVAAWFARTFSAPTPAQAEAWPLIQAGRDVLIAAPTGSGKTLAAFLAAIDTLVRESAAGPLPDETRVVYVSPLKALSNDVQKNLLAPLAGIDEELTASAAPAARIRTWVRTGDTPQQERVSMARRPPHILVTTPESLFILLGSDSGRKMLATARTVIVDEIHAVVGNKRGSHLALSLERLDALAGRALVRVGLSATQRPLEDVARFLVGAGRLHPDGLASDCAVVDSGHARTRDLALELPISPLESVMSGEQWEQVYDRIADLVRGHRSTLVFVNTRRHAERAARQLSERLGEAHVTAHHGSLARERRLDAEQRLKRGELKALVATASLELGIDIGDVDLVCQLGSTRSINAFLQRVGRSGHGVTGLPKGRLFPSSRDELVECAALLDAVRRGELDHLVIPARPLDVLAQQIVAEVASVEWQAGSLYELVRRAYPYRDLERREFDEIVQMLAEGFSTRRGRRGALVFHDGVHGTLRARRGAKLTAVTSGGTIPDTADYQVILEPEGLTVGSLNEDFAVESIAGDVFQLGNASYRILRVERNAVRVEDAKGQPPSIPFWLGEAPGRTDALSRAVSRLRHEVDERLHGGECAALDWLTGTVGLAEAPAQQLVAYLTAARAALGCLPTRETIVFERFFDEAGGMQLVVHSPYGSRINRAWGLALRKRFCRKFNFELQAAATEDCIVLSLTTAHSFELAEVARYLHSNSAREILVQALLAAPMFATRWRWTAGVALALPRFRGGRKVPPQIARMNAEDLIASIFPEQVGCAENQPGDIPVPDHPLIRQTLRDCLEEAMDFPGFDALLRSLESGTVRVVARDLTEPSPLALEVLSARPYAYLDDAPLEERRTQAVMSRRWLDPQEAAELGRLDPDAIARVREEAWPDSSTADELHDALMWLGFLTGEEVEAGPGWRALADQLAAEGRALELAVDLAEEGVDPQGARSRWIAVERWPWWRTILGASATPAPIEVPLQYERAWTREEALLEVVRGRLQASGPTTAEALAEAARVPVADVESALLALETEGFALRGQFDTPLPSGPGRSPIPEPVQWCERRLLARIHRYTVKRLRAEIEPVQAREFIRFLFDWQRLSEATRMQGPDAVGVVLTQLAGFDVPAGAWESEVLPARIAGYDPSWLDDHCLAGRYLWRRLAPRAAGGERVAAPVRATPIVLLPRRDARNWSSLPPPPDPQQASATARAVIEFIDRHGAAFYDEIVEGTQLLATQVETALAELVALGVVHADGFAGLRVLLLPVDRRRRPDTGRRQRGKVSLFGLQDAGRWTLVRRALPSPPADGAGSSPAQAEAAVEHVARALLQRWGVMFWKLYQREATWLPPWRELLMVYRRLEARGEVRGGRFVAGFSGEQYALPEAVGALRESRRRRADEPEWVSISAADPLNLVGMLTPGARIPALTGNRVLYRDGVPVAAMSGGDVIFYEVLEPAERWDAHNRLLRRPSSRAAALAPGRRPRVPRPIARDPE